MKDQIKNIARRGALCALTAAVVSFSAFALASCNQTPSVRPGGESSSASDDIATESMAFRKHDYSVSQFKRINLAVELELSGVVDADVTWSSSDENIAKIGSDGTVDGIKEGKIVVTATAGDVNATCNVTVTATDSLPTITFADGTYIPLLVGRSYTTAAPKVYIDGVEFEGEDITWENDEEANAVSLDVKGNGAATITAIAEGRAEIIVSATVRGVKAYEKITVNVMPNGVIFDAVGDGIVPAGKGYSVNLKAVEKVTGDGTTVCIPDVVATYGGNELDVTFKWASDNESVAIVSQSGRITAVAAGSAVVTGTIEYENKNYSVNLDVNVSQTETEKGEDKFIALNRSAGVTINAVDPTENAVEVSVNGNVISGAVSSQNGKITISKEAFAGVYDKRVKANVVVKTDKRAYFFDTKVVDYAIATLDEFKAWWNNPVWTSGSGSLPVVNHYVILENDIDARSYTPSGIQANEFQGVIDGQGHAIIGLPSQWNGVFYILGTNSVIKDLSIIGGRLSVGSDMFVGHQLKGTLENCYLDFSGGEGPGQFTNAGLANFINSTAVINNVVFVIHDRIGNHSGIGGIANVYENGAQVNGLYVINDDCDGNELKGNSSGNIVGAELYSSVDEMFDDLGGVPETFGEEWTLLGGKLLTTKVAAGIYGSLYGDGELTISLQTEKLRAGERFDLAAKIGSDTVSNATWIISGLNASQYVLDGDHLTVTDENAVGKQITIKAVYYAGGVYYKASAEKTLTVSDALIRSRANNTVDLDYDLQIINGAVSTASTANIDLSEIYNKINGKDIEITFNYEVIYSGKVTSSTVSVSLEKFDKFDSGNKEFEVVYSDGNNSYAITVPVVIVKNETFEINSTVVPNDNYGVVTLSSILNSYPTATFNLTSDLDLNGRPFNVVNEFKGTLDGNGHTIKNVVLTFNVAANDYNPVFINVNEGTIKNIGFVVNDYDFHIGNRTRGIVYDNKGTISNVFVEMTITSELNSDKDENGNWKHRFRQDNEEYLAGDYSNTGVLTGYNNGRIENVIVSVKASDSIKSSLGTYVFAIVALESKGAFSNVYAVKNGLTNAATVLYGGDTGIAAVDAYGDVLANENFSETNGWSKAWSNEGGEFRFGDTLIQKSVVLANMIKVPELSSGSPSFSQVLTVNANSTYFILQNRVNTDSPVTGVSAYKTSTTYTGRFGSSGMVLWRGNQNHYYTQYWFGVKVTTASYLYDSALSMEADKWYYFYIDLNEGKVYVSNEAEGVYTYKYYHPAFTNQVKPHNPNEYYNIFDLFFIYPTDTSVEYDVYVTDVYGNFNTEFVDLSE